ncbi:uncharacterized protein LY89DRAFT_770248 [Mollisia scopiformis]|uniref:BTB domain-containing protein n=1 Tax=Mollisia scopiformis TaxID=149040 RepID=A0A194XLR9_MOLSC|nr:uncharacterized protein LY89DRAFT_770248 [Mollisia scopiformis]KUJ21029.1 hypothetical protein LY89DRAFT_770248 [Mollisia scopiformis]
MATLLVGPKQVKIGCHKALLGYFSNFFYGALYGGFKEAVTQEISMPDYTPDQIGVFVTWAYSGRIETTLCAEELWILGDALQITDFTNEAMHLLFSIYGHRDGEWLTASAADYVWANTRSESTLRKFLLSLMIHDGPLCNRALGRVKIQSRVRRIGMV